MLLMHIPETHYDLFEGSSYIVLTTLMPDGQPQTTPVWCNREGDYVLINTMRGFQKEKNMRTNPKVTLLAYDPENPLHNIEIRGQVTEMEQAGAVEHLNLLTRLYMHKPTAQFFGDSVPSNLNETYVPVKIKIAPRHIRVED